MYPSIIASVVISIILINLVSPQNVSMATNPYFNNSLPSAGSSRNGTTVRSERMNIPIPRDYINKGHGIRQLISYIANQTRLLTKAQNSTDLVEMQSSIKRNDEKGAEKVDEKFDDKSDKDDSFEGKSIKLQPALTIPLKNAIIQELQPIDRQEAAAATASRLQDNSGYDSLGPDIGGEIIYEDELGGELTDWMPPPPPPPSEVSFRRRPFSSSFSSPFSSPSWSSPSSSSSGLSSLFQPGTSARLFGDDFALFLVILTIAGFFGLMLAMFMPFTFLMQQQLPIGGYPVGIGGGGLGGLGGLGGYPGAGVQSGYGGYPPYGRRRKRRANTDLSLHNHSLVDEHQDLESDFIRIMTGINEFISKYYSDSDPGDG